MTTASICAFLLLAQFDLNSNELYRKGNAYYQQGKYGEAIVAYEQVSEEITNSRVFYNLGNSYFKRGMLGKAILNFRKAHFLSPRDDDIAYNLDFARNYRVDRIADMRSPILALLSKIFRFVSLFETQLLATSLFLFSILLLSLLLIYRRKIFLYAFIGVIVLCLFFSISWQSWRAEITGSYAVVVAPEVSATSGPGGNYKEIIVVHDGAEVSVRETRGGYALIQLPGGIGGWVPTNTLEYIF